MYDIENYVYLISICKVFVNFCVWWNLCGCLFVWIFEIDVLDDDVLCDDDEDEMRWDGDVWGVDWEICRLIVCIWMFWLCVWWLIDDIVDDEW